MRDPVIPQLAVTEFLPWEAAQQSKFELHRGFVLSFAGGTIDHDTIAFNIRVALNRAYPAPCRTFGSDVKVRVADDTVYYADAGVVCDDVVGNATVIERPRIVVEVLSPSTQAYDLIEKRASYRSMPGLVAYVVAYTSMRRVEVDERNASGEWRTQTFDSEEAFFDGRSLAFETIYDRTSTARE